MHGPGVEATMKRELTAFASLSMVAVLGTALVAARPAPPALDESPGSDDFRTYCAPCHGPSGKGDGVLVPRMSSVPSDLTLLGRQNGGLFPSGRVSRAIDGRRPAKAHGPMPAWAEAFREPADERGKEAVKKRIQAIVDHVETLQAKEPAAAAEATLALCLFSNPSLPAPCTEAVALPPGARAQDACSALLGCLNDPRCIKTYCQATVIRQGWALDSARPVTAQR
jgi:hypothetical protein